MNENIERLSWRYSCGSLVRIVDLFVNFDAICAGIASAIRANQSRRKEDPTIILISMSDLSLEST